MREAAVRIADHSGAVSHAWRARSTWRSEGRIPVSIPISDSTRDAQSSDALGRRATGMRLTLAEACARARQRAAVTATPDGDPDAVPAAPDARADHGRLAPGLYMLHGGTDVARVLRSYAIALAALGVCPDGDVLWIDSTGLWDAPIAALMADAMATRSPPSAPTEAVPPTVAAQRHEVDPAVLLDDMEADLDDLDMDLTPDVGASHPRGDRAAQDPAASRPVWWTTAVAALDPDADLAERRGTACLAAARQAALLARLHRLPVFLGDVFLDVLWRLLNAPWPPASPASKQLDPQEPREPREDPAWPTTRPAFVVVSALTPLLQQWTSQPHHSQRPLGPHLRSADDDPTGQFALDAHAAAAMQACVQGLAALARRWECPVVCDMGIHDWGGGDADDGAMNDEEDLDALLWPQLRPWPLA
ncbi:hypothetical protein CXG81DRAFT_21281 [Caulochytrium protostelioides]|uniref:Uncharacterized protein n=1 Tax=Caulochytrium protostelioides TaxID=1555241 RepID=A0A4P9X154_9FUNG|nr:hypothetical protein CXG81DRAFT_21281 [Caulochytrium protostelioides]|eukprot:RKO98498.1 hypothetical protein CXG81DRAFT_21281 [Caulochytrium protostelioides]